MAFSDYPDRYQTLSAALATYDADAPTPDALRALLEDADACGALAATDGWRSVSSKLPADLPADIRQVFVAALVYADLRDRVANPAGRFDKRGRFYLTVTARCCASIRRPSAAYPYSEMVHGRTALHVATVAGVDVRELRRLARKL